MVKDRRWGSKSVEQSMRGTQHRPNKKRSDTVWCPKCERYVNFSATDGTVFSKHRIATIPNMPWCDNSGELI